MKRNVYAQTSTGAITSSAGDIRSPPPASNDARASVIETLKIMDSDHIENLAPA